MSEGSPRPVAEMRAPGPTARVHAGALAAVAAVVSSAAWWPMWVGGPARRLPCPCTDTGRAVWTFAWSAHAVSHLQNPLSSPVLHAPGGVNLLWDTGAPALAVLAAPLTWAAGPVVAFNVVVTLLPVAATLSAAWMLRRLGTSTFGVWAGALFFGCSPVVLVQDAYGWLNLSCVVLLPIAAGLAADLVDGRSLRPVRTGVGLGAVIAAELLVSTEILLLGAVVAVVAGVAGAACLISPRVRSAWRGRWRGTTRGLVAAAGTAAVLGALPLWWFFAGAAHLTLPVWPSGHADIGNTLGNFWRASGTFGPVTQSQLRALAAVVGGYRGHALPAPGFLGIGVLALLAAAAARAVRARDVAGMWLLAVTAAVGWLSLGSPSPVGAPWGALHHLPLLGDAVQSRLSDWIALGVAAAIARFADPAAAPAAPRSPRRLPFDTRRVARAAVVAALVPTSVVLATALPVSAQAVHVPAWFTAPAAPVPGDPVVLTYPTLTADTQSAEFWDASATWPFRLVGSGGPAGAVERAGAERAGYRLLAELSSPIAPLPGLGSGDLAEIRGAIGRWGVAVAVLPLDAGIPSADRGRGRALGAAAFTAVFGAPPVLQDGAWVWRPLPGRAGIPLDAAELARCAAADPAGVDRPTAAVACVMALAG